MSRIHKHLKKVVVAIHVLSIIFLVIAVVLFGDGFGRIKDDQFRYQQVCQSTPNNSISRSCVFSIIGEVLAALGLVPLVILTIVKLVRGIIGWVLKLINRMKEVTLFFRNKIFLIVETLILLFTSITVVIAAIMVCYGWKEVCARIKE